MKYWLLILSIFLPAVQAESARSEFDRMSDSALLIIDDQGNPVEALRADVPYIPASTTKLVTAWLALSRWGEEHRFETAFCRDPETATLWVRGSGDPFLVSDELRRVAQVLGMTGWGRFHGIGIDGSLLESDLLLPGTGTTNNPYDAIPSAVAANFNTVNLHRRGAELTSAEAETPLTLTARSLAKGMGNGVLRMNTGRSQRRSERHFAELMRLLLIESGTEIGVSVTHSSMPDTVTDCYRHRNSKTLGEMVKPMLKYSTNFIANQLVLMLVADQHGAGVSATDVERYLHQQLSQAFRWKNFRLRDGAGLSRDNRLSARQLISLIQAFEPWTHLLPEVEYGIHAKSGTLNGVSTLAGQMHKHGERRLFAILMNEPGSYRLRNRLAVELRSAW